MNNNATLSTHRVSKELKRNTSFEEIVDDGREAEASEVRRKSNGGRRNFEFLVKLSYEANLDPLYGFVSLHIHGCCFLRRRCRRSLCWGK